MMRKYLFNFCFKLSIHFNFQIRSKINAWNIFLWKQFFSTWSGTRDGVIRSWIAILGVWDECRGLGRILELPLSLSPASSLTFEVLSGFLFARQIVITIITIAVSYNLQAFCKQKHIVTVCVPWGGFLLSTNIHILLLNLPILKNYFQKIFFTKAKIEISWDQKISIDLKWHHVY